MIDFQVPSQNSFSRFSTFSSQTAHETDLHRIEIPLEFHMLSSGRNKSTTSFWLSSFNIIAIVIAYNLNYRNSSRPCLLVWCRFHRYVCSSASLKWTHVLILTSSGTNNTVWLSTAPTQPLTHWYQVKECLKQIWLKASFFPRMVLIAYIGALSSLAAHLRQARTGKWSP